MTDIYALLMGAFCFGLIIGYVAGYENGRY